MSAAIRRCSRTAQGFYETHVAVVEKLGAEDLLISGGAAIVIDHPETYALRRHCYINYQHVWTIEIRIENEGLLQHGFPTLAAFKIPLFQQFG